MVECRLCGTWVDARKYKICEFCGETIKKPIEHKVIESESEIAEIDVLKEKEKSLKKELKILKKGLNATRKLSDIWNWNIKDREPSIKIKEWRG